LRPSFKQGKERRLTKWVYMFLERNGLSIRRVTRVGQKLSSHLEDVRIQTCEAIRERFAPSGTLHGIVHKHFINMDQTAVYFEAKYKMMFNVKGANSVAARDSGSNTKRCTVVLAVAADGTKLPPFVIFKGKCVVFSIVF